MVGVFVAGAAAPARRVRHDASPSRAGGAPDQPDHPDRRRRPNRHPPAPRAPRRLPRPQRHRDVLALGAGDRLVGRTRYDRDSALAALPVVGGGLDPNLESMVALAPDLVVSWFSQERPDTRKRPRCRRHRLAQPLAARTRAMPSGDRHAGAGAGLSAEADRLLARLRDSLADTRRPRGRAGSAPGVLRRLQRSADDDGTGHLHRPDPRSRRRRQHLRRRRDELAHGVARGGRSPGSRHRRAARRRDARQTLGRLRTEPGWRELRAVRRGCVVQVDADVVNRPGPDIARGAEQLRVAIHRDGCGP